jgi:hypothetical protein
MQCTIYIFSSEDLVGKARILKLVEQTAMRYFLCFLAHKCHMVSCYDHVVSVVIVICEHSMICNRWGYFIQCSLV